jgi:chaperone required for assembly of F1-ATPase
LEGKTMSEWKLKRFWKQATVSQTDGGFAVLLDGRGVKTPAKAALAVPTRGLALAIAEEWDAQEGDVNPNTMPATRLANAAIDRVRVKHTEVAESLAAYGDSDLTCYRATDPVELAARQAAAWDPVLDWAADQLGARLQTRTGLAHQPQDAAALAVLSRQVHALDAFRLAAFHDLVGLSGSLVLGFAAAYDWASPEAVWDFSQVDEMWQEEQWGADDEAVRQSQLKRTDFLNAKRHWNLCEHAQN